MQPAGSGETIGTCNGNNVGWIQKRRAALIFGLSAVDRYVFQGVRKEGQRIWLEGQSRMVSWKGVQAVQTVLIDVTEQKLAELQLLEAREVAESANQAKPMFLSSMSHELRTPLNAVLGFSQVLATFSQPPLAKEQLEHVERIQKAGEHLLTLVEEILDLAKVEQGHLNLNLSDVDLDVVVTEAIDMVVAMASVRRVKFHNELKHGV